MTDTTRKTHLDTAAIVLLIGCAFTWGLGQVAGKAGLVSFPPLLQGGVRSLGAAALVLLWSRLRGIPIFSADGTLPGGLAAGALFATEFAFIFVGLQYTSASRMAVFIYLAPFVVAVGMPFVARSERLHAAQWLGLAVAFGGVMWAFAEGFTQPAVGDRQWLGDAMGIAAALLWGLTTLTLRATKLSSATPEKTLLYQLAISGLAMTAGAALKGEVWPAQVATWAGVSLVFQIVVVSFASYLVWFWLMRHYPATRISSFTLLTPMFGLLAGVLLLNEPLTARLLVALFAVCVGIWLVNRPVKRAS
jgi:drug/metabolite transporter (DMT)-like permease